MEKKRERRGVRSQGRGSRAGLRRRGRIRPGNSRAVVALCRQRDGQGLPARLSPAQPSLLCGQSPGTPGGTKLGSRGVSGAAGAEDAPHKSLLGDPKLSPKPSGTMLSRARASMSLALGAV